MEYDGSVHTGCMLTYKVLQKIFFTTSTNSISSIRGNIRHMSQIDQLDALGGDASSRIGGLSTTMRRIWPFLSDTSATMILGPRSQAAAAPPTRPPIWPLQPGDYCMDTLG